MHGRESGLMIPHSLSASPFNGLQQAETAKVSVFIDRSALPVGKNIEEEGFGHGLWDAGPKSVEQVQPVIKMSSSS